MQAQAGLVLRMAGPLLQILCLILLFRPDRPRTLLGLPTDQVLYAGLAVGLVMVLAGLILVQTSPRSRRRERERTRPPRL